MSRKEKIGLVVQDKMDKTVVVRVERRVAHPLYKKIIRRQSKFYAHDAKNESKTGDLVKIVETRPLSKTKRWMVSEIIERGKR
jgi:small subunit ribosomal protein S17